MNQSVTARQADEGFTLLEVAFVVLLLSILLAIAIAAFSASSDAANAAACRSNQDTFNTAVAIATTTDSAPDELADLEPYVKDFDDKITCPEDGTPLEFDAAAGRVSCPNHP